MKLLFACALIFTLFFTACVHGSGQNENAKPIALQQTALKPFSDSVKSDTFRVKLTGSKPGNMLLTFTIHSYNGRQIYHTVLKATELIDNYKEGTVDLKGEESQLRFLKEEVKLFFEEENFLEPAITQQEEADQHTGDKGFYNELKQTGLNGFKYRLSNESKVYIGWSVKEHKVKVYYKCC